MSFSFAEKDMMPIKLYEKSFWKGQDVFSIKPPLNYDQIMFHHFVYENSPVYGSIGRLFIPQFLLMMSSSKYSICYGNVEGDVF